MSLNAVSKHIRVLERAQLVRRRRAGREHYLAFNRAPLDEAAEWIETQRALWTTTARHARRTAARGRPRCRQTPRKERTNAMDDHGVVTAPGTLRMERLLPGPIERVWAYITEPEKRA